LVDSQKEPTGRGCKKINTTCIAGRSNEDDPSSEIYFYRTHYGHAGNLVGKILEQRSPANKKLFLQGDLAAWNKPIALLASRFDILFAGCSAHARRPFKIHCEDDDALCDQMLKFFLITRRCLRHTLLLKLEGNWPRILSPPLDNFSYYAIDNVWGSIFLTQPIIMIYSKK